MAGWSGRSKSDLISKSVVDKVDGSLAPGMSERSPIRDAVRLLRIFGVKLDNDEIDPVWQVHF